ncbi:MAG: tryptophan synthase subunit alpha [Rickettsiales bacterium]
MNRIDRAFAACAAQNTAAFIPFIMAGDPSLEACAALLDALPAAGADIIELGIPFSDPMADGPVIQAAGLRALAAGTTLHRVLDLVRNFRETHTTPIVLMGYLNPVYRYGYEAFAHDAAQAGVDGIILVDLPPEEAEEIEPILSEQGIALVRLVAPTSVPARLNKLTEHARGYLYYVSVTGITGAEAAPTARIAEHIAAIRAVTALPVCVGFGIKTPADVAAMAPLADGVVVGSAIVRHIHDTQADINQFRDFVAPLAAACRRS